MCRPFGEKAGLSLLPTLSVSARVLRVAKSKTLMMLPPPERAEKAISLSGAGDQVDRSAADSREIVAAPCRRH